MRFLRVRGSARLRRACTCSLPASDEGRHEPGPEPLWSESWYFDAISDDGSLAIYHRTARLPNGGRAATGSCVVRAGQPPIMLIDDAAPLPPADDDAQRVATPAATVAQDCVGPLERFELSIAGTGAAHADPAGPLRGEPGEPVEIAIEGVWETAGAPFMWRHSTRYEIPCRVEAEVTVAGETFALTGPGQRDHSWGARDWWASDWMWCALHLDDGTHAHAVAVPQHPNFAVGYVQRGDELEEVTAIRQDADFTADGLASSATIELDPSGFAVELEPIGFGAHLLRSDDGRVSHFPRAACRVRAADGRSGLGWIEWNRNQ